MMTNAPITAEIIPGISPSWHIVRSTPGRELYAVRHLAQRRFGCYLPTIDEWTKDTSRQSPLFSSYIFLFVWGLAEHIGRVKAVPGISGFLLNGKGEPILVPDQIIRDVQAIEWQCWLENLPRSFFRRRRRHEAWVVPNWRSPNRGFRELEPAERTAVLHSALGLKHD